MPYKDPKRSKENKKKYWLKNKEKIKRKRILRRDKNNETRRKHRASNLEKYRKLDYDRYYKEKENLLARKKIQYQKHKKEKLAYEKNKELTDKAFLLGNRLRSRLRRAISQNYRQSGIQDLLGCSLSEAKKYLESLFLKDMSWGNYGRAWHIDHRRPCASFDLTNVEQQKQCFHYTNLQPLWARDNLSKGKKYQETP